MNNKFFIDCFIKIAFVFYSNSIFCAEYTFFYPATELDNPTIRAITYFSSKSYNTSDDLETIANNKGLISLNFEETVENHKWKVYPFLDHQDFPTHHIGLIALNSLTSKIIISYHGTRPSSIKRFLGDLSITLGGIEMVDFKGHQELEASSLEGKIHKGYSEIIKRSIPCLKSQLDRAIVDVGIDIVNTEFIFTGHSMGGALTTIGAARFLDEYFYLNRPHASQIKIFIFNPSYFGDIIFHERLHEIVGRVNIICFKHIHDAVIGGFKYYLSANRVRSYENEIGLVIPLPIGVKEAGYIGHSIPDVTKIVQYYNTMRSTLKTLGEDQELYQAGKISLLNNMYN